MTRVYAEGKGRTPCLTLGPRIGYEGLYPAKVKVNLDAHASQ